MKKLLTTTALLAVTLISLSNAEAASLGSDTNNGALANENNNDKANDHNANAKNNSPTGLSLSGNPNQPVRNSVGRADNPVANTNATSSIPVEGTAAGKPVDPVAAGQVPNANIAMDPNDPRAKNNIKIIRGTSHSTTSAPKGASSSDAEHSNETPSKTTKAVKSQTTKSNTGDTPMPSTGSRSLNTTTK